MIIVNARVVVGCNSKVNMLKSKNRTQIDECGFLNK